MIKHAGNFDLACSTATKEMNSHEEAPKEEEEHHPWRGCHWRGGRGGHGRNPFKHMVQQFFNNMMQNGQTSSSDSDSDSEEQRK